MVRLFIISSLVKQESKRKLQKMKNNGKTIALIICLIMVIGALTTALTIEQTAASNFDHQSTNKLEKNNQTGKTVYINEIKNSTYPFGTPAPYRSWSYYNFPGDGSAANPYLIDGPIGCNGVVDVVPPYKSIGSISIGSISIVNTNAYFSINVTSQPILNALAQPFPQTNYNNGCGIILSNVTHGQIVDSFLNNTPITIENSQSIKVLNSDMPSNWVSLWQSNNSIIEGNRFNGVPYDYSQTDITITRSNNNTITDNTLNDSVNGIVLRESNNITVKDNIFKNVNNTYQDISGMNNVFVSISTSKSTPGETFELMLIALITIAFYRKKGNTNK